DGWKKWGSKLHQPSLQLKKHTCKPQFLVILSFMGCGVKCNPRRRSIHKAKLGTDEPKE
ncbi:unnamed protein product, partial [Porites evermanni]